MWTIVPLTCLHPPIPRSQHPPASCSSQAELPAGLEGGLSGEDALPKLVKELQDASALIGHLRREVAHQSARIAELAERGAQGGGTYSDRYEAWIPSAQRDAAAKDPALAQLLRKVARQSHKPTDAYRLYSLCIHEALSRPLPLSPCLLQSRCCNM